LKEGEAGDSVKEVCRRQGVSPATYYQWKSKYGGLQPSDLKRMKELITGLAHPGFAWRTRLITGLVHPAILPYNSVNSQDLGPQSPMNFKY